MSRQPNRKMKSVNEVNVGTAGTTASKDSKPVDQSSFTAATDTSTGIAEETDDPPAVSMATDEEIASAQALADAGETVTTTLLQARLKLSGYQQAKRIFDAWLTSTRHLGNLEQKKAEAIAVRKPHQKEVKQIAEQHVPTEAPTPVTTALRSKLEPSKKVPVKGQIKSTSGDFSILRPSEFLAMQFDPKDQYFANGLFARGQPLCILGPGGLGKSRLLLLLAVCTILGRPFLGMTVSTKNLRWLILQAENSSRRLQADLRALKDWVGEKAWTVVDRYLAIQAIETSDESDLNLGDKHVVEKLTKLVAGIEPDVIAIDPLAAVAAGSLNNDAGMRATCRALDKLAKSSGKRASIVLLHHTLTGKTGASKATGVERGSYGRGSKWLNSWTRGQINIAAVNQNHNESLIISCGKNSNGREFAPFGVRIDSNTMICEVDPKFDYAEWQQEFTGTSKTKLKDKLTPEDVAAFVQELGLKKKELIRAIMDETGCSKSTAYNAITTADGTTIVRHADKKFRPAQ
jgi:hypothetical protein